MENSETLKRLLALLTEKAASDGLDVMDTERLTAEAEATENRLLEKALTFPAPWQADRYLCGQVAVVAELDDGLWAAAGATPGESHPLAMDCCRVLHRLCRRLLRNVEPDNCGSLLISRSFRMAERDAIVHRWAAIRERLERVGCDDSLLHLLDRPVHRLAATEIPYSVHDYRYLMQYLESWEDGTRDTRVPAQSAIIELLIHLDYNSPRIFTYIIDAFEGNRETVEAFIQPLGLVAPLPYAPETPGLLEELTSWLDDGRVPDPITLGTSMPEFAVFGKMCQELGLITESSFATLSKKLARGFATKGAFRIQHHSLLKKFSVRDTTVKNTIKRWLWEMERWLDRNMN